MSITQGLLTGRRQFLAQLAAAGMWSASSASAIEKPFTGFAFVPRVNHIEVFRVKDSSWTFVERVVSPAPASLALHPNRSFLYVANKVCLHGGLPRGTVQVLAIDQRTGALLQVQRQALSLSATEPNDLAISPNGRQLAVAVYGGGAYNILPIGANGFLGAVKTILKEVGGGTHSEYQGSAHPHSLLYDKTGRFLVTSDLGCDRLSVFAVSEGGQMERRCNLSLPPGAGPGSIAFGPAGDVLYVRHELSAAISCHRYRPSEGTIEEQFQIIPVSASAQRRFDRQRVVLLPS